MCGCRVRAVARWRAAVSPALLLLLLLIAIADADFDSMSPMPFLMGSRYGRSSGPKMVSSRSDRFFMGTRYGKRSEDEVQPLDVPRSFDGVVGDDSNTGVTRKLVCEFTGVSLLYRCVGHNKRDPYDARIGDESGMEEDVV